MLCVLGDKGWNNVTINVGDTFDINAPTYLPILLRESSHNGSQALIFSEWGNADNTLTILGSTRLSASLSFSKTNNTHVVITNISTKAVAFYYKLM